MPHMFSDLAAFRRDPLGFLLERGSSASEPLVRMHVGPSPVYLVADAALVKPILNMPEERIDKGRLVYKLREVIGHSSITLSGPEHRRRRSAIHEQLRAGLAGGYVPEIAATIRQFAVGLAAEGSAPVAVPRLTAQLALRIICTILFGHGTISSGDEAAIVEAVHLVEDDLAEGMFRVLPHTPWAYVRKKRKLRDARRVMALVVERMRKRSSPASLFGTFERLRLEGPDLRDEVLLMLLAGHHTSGTAMAWLLYHLAIEEAAARQIAAEAGQLADPAGELRPSAVKDAARTRAFVQEVLRLYPSTYWLSRETKEPMEIEGFKLARGTSLIVSPWHLHRDPRHWQAPERFDATRSFAGKAYIPFGVGPRACVGTAVAMLELQLVALEFASTFDMQVHSQVPAAPPHPSVTLVPSAIQMSFALRASADARNRQAA